MELGRLNVRAYTYSWANTYAFLSLLAPTLFPLRPSYLNTGFLYPTPDFVLSPSVSTTSVALCNFWAYSIVTSSLYSRVHCKCLFVTTWRREGQPSRNVVLIHCFTRVESKFSFVTYAFQKLILPLFSQLSRTGGSVVTFCASSTDMRHMLGLLWSYHSVTWRPSGNLEPLQQLCHCEFFGVLSIQKYS